MNSLSRRVVGEVVGTAMLLATVVGSGIMGERLSDGNLAIALLANTSSQFGRRTDVGGSHATWVSTRPNCDDFLARPRL